MFILEEENRDLFIRVQEQNLNRQYDLLTNCIEIGLVKGPVSFDKYLLWSLNHVAEVVGSARGVSPAFRARRGRLLGRGEPGRTGADHEHPPRLDRRASSPARERPGLAGDFPSPEAGGTGTGIRRLSRRT